MKIKKFYDFDLQIVGYEEGTGRNKGRLGAFVVDYNGNKVKVGSGYSDEERVNEIARIIGGSISSFSLEHASLMLEAGKNH